MKIKHFARRRISTLLLSLAVAAACLPFTGEEAYADTQYPAPNYDGSFEVYSNHFFYAPFTIGGGNNPNAFTSFYSPKLYMEYSADGGRTWKKTGYMQYNSVSTASSQRYRMSGLKPNTNYRTRIFYGDDSGNPISPYRSCGIIKTGKKSKPAVRSVTAKAVNVRYHKAVRPGYYYWTGYSYIWTRPTKMKYYTYNVKVTVRLRKKPGTKGIWVNGRWLKGNKKKYTATFTIPSPHNMSAKKPRGHVKYTVSIRSGQSKSYGGYSPEWKRTMKLR